MQLRHIGELDLLKEVRRRFSSSSQIEDGGVIVGIGDDAAVIAPRKEKLLVTTDMMNEGVHFDLGYTSPFPLGFKLVSVNVSDIMAMGGRPEYLFLDIALKGDADEGFFRELYDGIAAALDVYGMHLLGGDLTSAFRDAVLSATVLGSAGRVVTRGGASPGDKIYVTSTVGDSACGLEILKRLDAESRKTVTSNKFQVTSKDSKDQDSSLVTRHLLLSKGSSLGTLEWETAEPLIRRHLMPVARESRSIAPYATAMIDVSDGLFMDLCRICDESGTGARVYLDRIPVSGEMRQAAGLMGLDPMHFATTGGEDYELLFTANDRDALSVMRNELKDNPSQPPLTKGGSRGGDASRITHHASRSFTVTCIGEITKEDRVVVDAAGRESVLKAEGYQHFGSP